MSRSIDSWVESPLHNPASRHTTLTGASRGILVGLGLAVATYLIGVGSGRAVIKLGYATVTGLAVGEVVIGHRAGSDGEQYELPGRRLHAVGTAVGLALTIGPYTLQPLWITRFQATVGAVLISISLLLGVGWGVGRTRECGCRWNAIWLAGTGFLVVGLAVLIPN